jgi:hypothetical protein
MIEFLDPRRCKNSIFAPVGLCIEMQLRGCISGSGFYDVPGIWTPYWRGVQPLDFVIENSWLQRFVQNDFTGVTEQAKKNRTILWGPPHRISYQDQGLPFDPYCSCSKCVPHQIIELYEDRLWEFIEGKMKK